MRGNFFLRPGRKSRDGPGIAQATQRGHRVSIVGGCVRRPAFRRNQIFQAFRPPDGGTGLQSKQTNVTITPAATRGRASARPTCGAGRADWFGGRGWSGALEGEGVVGMVTGWLIEFTRPCAGIPRIPSPAQNIFRAIRFRRQPSPQSCHGRARTSTARTPRAPGRAETCG